METKRLVLAFALSAAVLIGWTVLFPPPKPAAPARAAGRDRGRTGCARDGAGFDDGRPRDAARRAPARARAARESVVPVFAGAEETVEVREPAVHGAPFERGRGR